MKLIVVPVKVRGAIGFPVEWQYTVTFAGEPPSPKVPIAIDLPGLKSLTWQGLRAWVDERRPEASASRKKRSLELPEGCWREAVLDDFVDGQLEGWFTPHNRFSLDEYCAFVAKWSSEVQSALQSVGDAPAGKRRLKALKQARLLTSRVVDVMAWIPEVVARQQDRQQAAGDRARMERIYETAPEIECIVQAIVRVKSDRVRLQSLIRLARDLASDEAVGPEEMHRALDLIGEHRALRDAVHGESRFWEVVAPKVQLSATVADGTFDITDGGDLEVELGWDVYRATRIGPIVPGRTALAIWTRDGGLTLVRGERKLKFEAMRRGGAMVRHGCTLTVRPDPAVAIQSAFLDVERLDTIAALDPAQALEAVAELGLPDDHLVVQTARAAVTDLSKRRVLADLLVELRHGLDPQVARECAHISTRRGR
jgi:hypothetical protein